jgi:hypothetical protein
MAAERNREQIMTGPAGGDADLFERVLLEIFEDDDSEDSGAGSFLDRFPVAEPAAQG